MLRPGQARQMPWLTAVDCSRPLLRAHGGHAGLLRSCAGADGVRVGPRPAEPVSGIRCSIDLNRATPGSEGSSVPATEWSVADRVVDFARSWWPLAAFLLPVL